MNTIVVPTLKDPRLLLLVFFLFLASLVASSAAFSRDWAHFLSSAGICISLDFLFVLYFDKKLVLPMSGLITSFGVFFLVDSPLLWVTGLAATLAIGSKHLLRFRGRHIFNPGNFGVFVTMLALPDWANLGAHRWAGRPGLVLLLFGLGLALVIRVNRHVVSLTYFFSFVLFAVAKAQVMDKPFWTYALSIFGPAMPLYIFYMISDPRTTPSDRRAQFAFGLAVAAADSTLRHYQYPYATMAALFGVCAVFAGVRCLNPQLFKGLDWRTKEVQVGAGGSEEGMLSSAG